MKDLAKTAILLVFVATACVAVRSQPPRYDLNIKLDPAERRFQANGTLIIPPSSLARKNITLSLSNVAANFRADVTAPYSRTRKVSIEKTPSTATSAKIVIHLSEPVPPNKAIELRFSYDAAGTISSQYYIGPEVSFASAWGTDWYPALDDKNAKAIGKLSISVPNGQMVYATGKRISGLREQQAGLFRFNVAHPTYFAFAAGNYTVVRSRGGSVPIAAYLLSPRQNIDQYLDGVSRILNVLSQEFGRYPFGELALVEIPRDLAQRASFAGAAMQGSVLLNSRAFDVSDVKFILNYFGHEFAHQWFPHTTALKTPPGLYMEESLAEYGGLRVVETLEGPEAAENYRRSGFEYDPGYSALLYFKQVEGGIDQPLSQLKPGLNHRNLAYSKGSIVFDMLSREIGRQKFQKVLHRVTANYAFRSITWNKLLREIEKGAGRDLRWFYGQWFDRDGAPDFRLTWHQDGVKIKGTIEQIAPFFRAKIEVLVQGVCGEEGRHLITVGNQSTNFVFNTSFRVKNVILDPNYKVLRRTSSYSSFQREKIVYDCQSAGTSADNLAIQTQAVPGKFTEADVAKLKWIEGTWRGTGAAQPAFFERYKFEGTTLIVESLADETMQKVNGTSRYEINKDGEFGTSDGDNRSAASTIRDTAVQFIPVKGSKNSYRFEKQTDGLWQAVIEWPADGDKPARKIVYKMEPWPKR